MLETIDATFELVPLALVLSSKYREARPEIRATIRTELDKLVEESSTPALAAAQDTAVPLKNKRGRPTSIPAEAKDRALAAQRQGAKAKEVAQMAYNTPHPTRRQMSDVGNILANYERSKKS
jgi:hypothetical protein